MPDIGRATADEFYARAARRLAVIDPLLPEAAERPPGCGAVLAVGRAYGSDQPVAIATCEPWEGEPGSIDLTWGAARRFRLFPAIAGPDVAGGLDSLIQQWREHLASTHDTDGEDTAAGIVWPSRDAEGIRVLLRHGMAPRGVVAACAARFDRAELASARRGAGDVVIRRAGPADIDAVTSLGMALIRYDDYFGFVVERPHTEEALLRESAEVLADPEPWTWLAERDGVAVGMLKALSPENSTWYARMTSLAPLAYLQQAFVLPAERGSGVGSMLIAAFHAELAKVGVAVVLMLYSQVNPFAASFWSQHRYRPLWTAWEARPAYTLR